MMVIWWNIWIYTYSQVFKYISVVWNVQVCVFSATAPVKLISSYFLTRASGIKMGIIQVYVHEDLRFATQLYD